MQKERKKILLAPDSFKGSLEASEVVVAMEQGIRRVMPDASLLYGPLSDGGEGWLANLMTVLPGSLIEKEVHGPDGNVVKAKYGLLQDGIAIVELAQASGLSLSSKRNPMLSNTLGTGELIRDALDRGARKVILGIGGSATNDAGIGLASALGVAFLNAKGESIELNARGLAALEEIKLTDSYNRCRDIEFLVACDVQKPLIGPDGASFTYAPQKGADFQMVLQLDAHLRHFANKVESLLGEKIADVPGAGAAGGVGGGMMALLGAKLVSGIDLYFELIGLDDSLNEASLVLSGEGRIDEQTIQGKALLGLARRAKIKNVPMIALCGSYTGDLGVLYQEGMGAIYAINHGQEDWEQARLFVRQNIADSTEQIIRTLQLEVTI